MGDAHGLGRDAVCGVPHYAARRRRCWSQGSRSKNPERVSLRTVGSAFSGLGVGGQYPSCSASILAPLLLLSLDVIALGPRWAGLCPTLTSTAAPNSLRRQGHPPSSFRKALEKLRMSSSQLSAGLAGTCCGFRKWGRHVLCWQEKQNPGKRTQLGPQRQEGHVKPSPSYCL